MRHVGLHSHFFTALLSFYVLILGHSGMAFFTMDTMMPYDRSSNKTEPKKIGEDITTEELLSYAIYAVHGLCLIICVVALVFNDLNFCAKMIPPLMFPVLLIINTIINISGTVLLGITSAAKTNLKSSVDPTHSLLLKATAGLSALAAVASIVGVILTFFFPARKAKVEVDDESRPQQEWTDQICPPSPPPLPPDLKPSSKVGSLKGSRRGEESGNRKKANGSSKDSKKSKRGSKREDKSSSKVVKKSISERKDSRKSNKISKDVSRKDGSRKEESTKKDGSKKEGSTRKDKDTKEKNKDESDRSTSRKSEKKSEQKSSSTKKETDISGKGSMKELIARQKKTEDSGNDLKKDSRRDGSKKATKEQSKAVIRKAKSKETVQKKEEKKKTKKTETKHISRSP